jgi:hypothetical protein
MKKIKKWRGLLFVTGQIRSNADSGIWKFPQARTKTDNCGHSRSGSFRRVLELDRSLEPDDWDELRAGQSNAHDAAVAVAKLREVET